MCDIYFTKRYLRVIKGVPEIIWKAAVDTSEVHSVRVWWVQNIARTYLVQFPARGAVSSAWRSSWFVQTVTDIEQKRTLFYLLRVTLSLSVCVHYHLLSMNLWHIVGFPALPKVGCEFEFVKKFHIWYQIEVYDM